MSDDALDVSTDAATSLWCSGNLFFSVFFSLCTCSLLLLYRTLELICMHLYIAADAVTSYLFW